MTTLPWIYDDGGRHAEGHRPRGVGDCSIRAIAIATGHPYTGLADHSNELARTLGDRRMYKTRPAGLKHRDYLALLRGWTYTKARGGTHFNAEEFVIPGPVAIVRLHGHVVAVINGVIHDTWDCSKPHGHGRHEGRYRLVRGYWLAPAGFIRAEDQIAASPAPRKRS